MLTRKHYRMIAQVIQDSRLHTDEADRQLNATVSALCSAFRKDNPNFDAFKFIKACQAPDEE